MPVIYNIQNSIIGLILVTIMLYYVLGQKGKRQAQDSLFVSLLFSALGLLLLEMSIDILSGRIFAGSRIFLTSVVLFFYLLVPLPGALYFLYIDQLYKHWHKVPPKIGLLIFIPILINAGFTVMSLFNGMIFTIDATNTYQRGDFFFLVALFSVLYVLGSHVHLIRTRQNHKAKPLSVVISFPFPVFIAAVLQMHLEGMKILGVSFAITLLIKFLHSQNTHANRDSLTSLYNRSIGEEYLNHLINYRKKNIAIGGILMDINSFKQANDTYGHDLGDKTLRYFSRLLIESFYSNWLISRYGGDEFILFRESSTQQDLEKDLAHFIEMLARFNAKESLPFSLSLSIGSALYESIKHKDGPSFIKDLDRLMYMDKRMYHANHKAEILPL